MIECTLPLVRVPGRLQLIAGLADDALLDRSRIPGGVRYRFRDDRDIERRVREVADLESQCCAFLTFEIGRADGAVVLDITGAEEALPVIESFFAFEPFKGRTRGTARRG